MRTISTLFRRATFVQAILLSVIVMVAALFRFYRLGQVPPGLQFDEAFYAFDVLRLLQGQFAIFFPANNGREPLYLYMSLVGVALFGPQAIALRLTSAIIGTATIPLVYGFARSLFRSVQAAVFSAAFAAISVWHIYYSRYGLRVILSVPLTILTVWWFWRAVNRHRSRDYALAGLCAALAAYTYLSARFLPFILIALTISAIALDRAHLRDYLKGLIITALVALVVFLPLGIYFLGHPTDFIAHAENLSLLDPRVSQGNVFEAFMGNLGAVAGMFLLRGDHLEFRNIANRPVFDPLVGALFVLGLLVAIKALLARSSSVRDRLCALFILVPLLFFESASVFSDDAPNFTRTLAALPFAMILPAWAADALWQRFRSAPMRPIVVGALGALVFASGAIAFRDYFVDFANSPSLYYSFDMDRYDAAVWANQNAATNHIYLAPLWYQHGTVSLMTRNTPLKSYESRDTVVLPSNADGKDALIAYPLEQEKKAETLGERLGGLAAREDVYGSNGAKMLAVYRVPAQNLPDPLNPLATLARGGAFIQPQRVAHAVWADQMELLGESIEAADTPKRNLEVTLFLQVLKPMSEDYTFSIKVRDEKDRVWGQEDKWLGDNSYATTQMRVGDVVIEKFYPGLNACAPAGGYRITAELYNPRTGAVVGLSDGSGSLVDLGTWDAEASAGNRLEDLEIDQSLDVDVAPQMHLLGFTLTPREVRAGDAFSLSLFWRGVGNGLPNRSASVHLRDSVGRDFPLAQPQVNLPVQDRGLCTFLDLRAPADSSVGAANLFVNNSKITTLTVTR